MRLNSAVYKRRNLLELSVVKNSRWMQPFSIVNLAQYKAKSIKVNYDSLPA